jgi:hypothetical protein
MRAGRRDAQPFRSQERGEGPAELQHFVARLADVGADLRADLDHRLHHLGLDPLAEMRPRRHEERVDVALQLTVGIDDLELLLDPDGEARDVRDPHARPSTT